MFWLGCDLSYAHRMLIFAGKLSSPGFIGTMHNRLVSLMNGKKIGGLITQYWSSTNITASANEIQYWSLHHPPKIANLYT